MHKKYHTYIPSVLAIVLIVSILAVVLSIVNSQSSPTHSIPNEQTSGNEEENIGDQDENNDIPNTPIEYFTDFPKIATESDDFFFLQSIQGYKDIILKEVFQTNNYVYAIFETDCEFGDVQTDKLSIGVALISPFGNIEKIMILPSRIPLSFLSASLSGDGLVIMGKTEENILVFEVDIDINKSETITLPLADNGRLFPSQSGTLIMTGGSQNIVYRLSDSLETGFLPQGQIVEIYDFYNYIMIFMNSDNGYHILRLSNNLSIMQNTLMSNAQILSVIPFYDLEQKFVIVEKSSDSVTLFKYDMTFNKQNADFVAMAPFENIDIFNYNNQILTVITGDFNAIYTFNNELESSLSSLFSIQPIIQLFQAFLYDNGIRILAKTSNGLVVIEYCFDSSYTTYKIDDDCVWASFVVRPSGKIIVFYNVINKYEFVEIAIKAL